MVFSVLGEIARTALRRATGGSDTSPCPVCTGDARILGEVNFNKSCEGRDDIPLPKSNAMIRYYVCSGCGFCFAPEFRKWSDRKFKARIYNDDYVLVDPEYVATRPEGTAKFIGDVFGPVRERITHLDYGGGNGLMSQRLRAGGWQSSSYDHFANGPGQLAQLSTYDLVTAFEVFEHVVDPLQLMASLSKLTHAQSLIVFSTLLSEGHIACDKGLDWWYLAPRNGHISLFSEKSLTHLLGAYGYRVHHVNDGLHLAFRELPAWSHEVSIFGSI